MTRKANCVARQKVLQEDLSQANNFKHNDKLNFLQDSEPFTAIDQVKKKIQGLEQS